MAVRAAHGVGAQNASQGTTGWWVITFSAPSGNKYQYFLGTQKAAQALANQAVKGGNTSNLSGPFASKADAQAAVAAGKVNTGQNEVANPVTGWLSSLGGMIASGLEAGLVQFFKDLWNVIAGPVEVLLGVVIAIVVLAIYFKDDIARLAPMIAMAAA
jgi:hypothetical protein